MTKTRSFGLIVGALALASTAQAREALRALDERGLGPGPAQLVARADLERGGVRAHVLWDPASGCPRHVRFQPALGLEARSVRASCSSGRRGGWRSRR